MLAAFRQLFRHIDAYSAIYCHTLFHYYAMMPRRFLFFHTLRFFVFIVYC